MLGSRGVPRPGARPFSRAERAFNPRCGGDGDLTVLFAATQLGPRHTAAQDEVDGGRNVVVDRNLVAVDDLDDRIERRRGLALQNRFLRSPAPRFFIGQRHRLNAANEVGKRRVHHQIFESVAMGGTNELYAPLGDGSRAAIASNSVPISSITTTSGIWFSTASIITPC